MATIVAGLIQSDRVHSRVTLLYVARSAAVDIVKVPIPKATTLQFEIFLTPVIYLQICERPVQVIPTKAMKTRKKLTEYHN
jgi:hypothetical protein